MESRIDKFNKRLNRVNDVKKKVDNIETSDTSLHTKKTYDDKKESIVSVLETNNVDLVSAQFDESAILQREKSLKSSIDEIAGKMFIKKSNPKKNSGFIFDILSNSVIFEAENQQSSDFILYENDLFPINSQGIVDAETDRLVNVRTSYIYNDLRIVSALVAQTMKTSSNMAGTNNKFYLLPDNTDVFSQNIKSAFYGGYRFVWRSIIAAYTNYDKNSELGSIDVIDLHENEPMRVVVKSEYSEEYKTHIFTRRSKVPVEKLNPVSFFATAIAFWNNLGSKFGVNFDAKKLALTADTFELLCKGTSFTLHYSGNLYKIDGQDAKVFLNNYFRKYSNELTELNGCAVFGDHLKNAGITGIFKYVDSVAIGGCLAELKRRVKKDIPLWQETLPKLALQRIAVNGRLGEYILVDEGRTVPNTFGAYPVSCEELLKLPAGHTVIRFPLTISGINNKSFIAKVELEQELVQETAFKVTLKYDFNNEYSYHFEVENGDKTYMLSIEEGLPEKMYLPFEMDIKFDKKLLKDIYNYLLELLSCIKQRNVWKFSRPNYDNGMPKERNWEYNARNLCNRIASKILDVPYSIRTSKSSGVFGKYKSVLDEIYQYIEEGYRTDIGENIGTCIDKCYIGLVHSTISLFSDYYDFDNNNYKSFLENREGHPYLKYAVESKVLCNPTLDIQIIDDFLFSRKGNDLIRTFALPLLANDALLEFICTDRSGWLRTATTELKEYFRRINSAVKTADAESLRNYVRGIRDGYELTLGLLKLRGTEFWSEVQDIEEVLSDAVEIEHTLYDILSRVTPQVPKFVDLYKAQNWHFGNKAVDCDLSMSRVTFNEESFTNLQEMHPLALTAITYLEGNPDIHIIGCGLRAELD